MCLAKYQRAGGKQRRRNYELIEAAFSSALTRLSGLTFMTASSPPRPNAAPISMSRPSPDAELSAGVGKPKANGDADEGQQQTEPL